MRAPTNPVSINHVGTGVLDRPLTQQNLRMVREAHPYEHRIRLCKIKELYKPEFVCQENNLFYFKTKYTYFYIDKRCVFCYNTQRCVTAQTNIYRGVAQFGRVLALGAGDKAERRLWRIQRGGGKEK